MNPAVEEFEQAVAAKPPEAWYDLAKKEYLIEDQGGEWYSINETQFKRVLKQHGLSARVDSGKTTSAQDEAILKIQQSRNVHFAGPMAGYRKGFHPIGNARVLVTSSPRIIAAGEGDWLTLRKLMTGLLGEGIQFETLNGWLKTSYEALRDGRLRPGQALVMCGPHNCGKSLLQNLITVILGGRAAKPYQALTGGTSFNADLFGAEHLMVEDEQPATDINSRRKFGAAIKGVTVNEGQRLHAKHRDAILLKPFWRLSVSLNDETENLMVLPPVDDSLADKMILLKVSRSVMPMPSDTGEEREAFWGQLLKELPAFISFLESWKIPDTLRCPRFGVRHYHNPEILEALDALAPELRLLSLIDATLFTLPHTYADMTAEVLEQQLTGDGAVNRYEARKLLSWNNATGTYLGRLAKKRPDRVESTRSATERKWRLHPPAGKMLNNDTLTPSLIVSKEKNTEKEGAGANHTAEYAQAGVMVSQATAELFAGAQTPAEGVTASSSGKTEVVS